MMAIRFILSFYICLISIYISGQQQKLDSLETYFNQFYTVEFVDANNENILFTKNKNHELPVYYLKNNKKANEIRLGRIMNYHWLSEKYFLYVEKNEGLILYNIQSQSKKAIPHYQKMIETSNRNLFIAKKEGNTLYINTINNGELGNEMKFIDVIDYKWENDKLVTEKTNHTIDVYELNKNINPIFQIAGVKYQSLRWNKSNQYDYIKQEGEDVFYVKSNGTKVKLLHDLNKSINLKIINEDNNLLILENTFQSDYTLKKSEEVEIWDTSDDQIIIQKLKSQKELIFIQLNNGEVKNRISLTDVNYEFLGTQYLLIFDKNRYRSYRHLRDHVDVKLMDLVTLNQKLIVEDFDDYNRNKLILSDHNKFIYFKENNWWIYDVLEDKKESLTTSIKAGFSVDDYFKNEAFQPAKFHDNSRVFLTAKEGIWEYNLHTKKLKQLIESTKQTGTFTFLVTRNKAKNEADETIYIQFLNENNQYKIYKCCDRLNEIYNTSQDVKKVSLKNKNLYVMEQGYLKSPHIVQIDEKNKATIRVEAANSIIQKRRFHEIKSTINGKSVKAILYYPFDYDSTKYYPMIVHIYQKQSHLVNDFQLPEVSSANGFNTDFYTSQGYFVLLPDIIVDLDQPGESALQCTVEATNQALKEANIDRDKIGLIGHSYGGFEVNYIVNRTNMFKAAVSGSGVSDIVNWYFSMDWNKSKTQFWRFEDEFFKMSSMFYDSKENYLKQSPLLQLENLHTPVLIWTGKEDYQVNWEQSVSMYLAMRLLKKEGKLLLYPNEKHVIMNPSKAKDLNQRIINWFDFYLKNTEIDWIKNKRQL